ncbi:hypothetical protein [Cellulomonas chengniuliangii]|uniref:Polysaccharide biosynthesis protein n=1 Tax=Cellulomonas chengniuliangii TaxID=2968084 RepID=A0ABY5KZ57_9CELL|nr:hypothetical protein [Cellulomonas chengniuliangii]MCC2308738.1 hypothetical protein [Cellulomonas chengniuliangii]UUI74511.1 hypothetical protein NP064_11985 [Cellulomonas chengniuliangii]
MTAPAQGSADLTARGVTGVGVASLVAAVSTNVVLLIAARSLSPAANADFLVFWSVLFACFGVLGGVQNETTRAVRVARTTAPAPGADPRARVLPIALLTGAALAGALLVTSPAWGRALLGPGAPTLTVALALALIAFSGHSAVAGALGGAGSWPMYARLVGSEAIVRLVLVGAVALVGAPLVGVEVASAAAAATWIGFFALSSRTRSAQRAVADVDASAFVRRTAHAMLAAASSAALVVGFPVLLRLTTPTSEFELAAPLILAISMTRAPLLMPLNAYQGVAITHFLSHRQEGIRPLARIVGAIMGVGAAGALLAVAVGPWLMRALFGTAYHVDGLLLGALTGAAAMLAVLTLTGAAVLALDKHKAYASSWGLATLVTVAVLLLPLDLEARAVLALALGPLAGVALHGIVLIRPDRTGR